MSIAGGAGKISSPNIEKNAEGSDVSTGTSNSNRARGEIQPTCPICTTPLPPAEGNGRPANYCSAECRRQQSYKIRRIQRQLEQFDDLTRACRLGWALHTPDEEPQYLAEVARLEQRQRELLGG